MKKIKEMSIEELNDLKKQIEDLGLNGSEEMIADIDNELEEREVEKRAKIEAETKAANENIEKNKALLGKCYKKKGDDSDETVYYKVAYVTLNKVYAITVKERIARCKIGDSYEDKTRGVIEVTEDTFKDCQEIPMSEFDKKYKFGADYKKIAGMFDRLYWDTFNRWFRD